MKNREALKRGFAGFVAAVTVFAGTNPGNMAYGSETDGATSAGAAASGAEKVLDYGFEGNLADRSGKGNDGTAVGTVDYATDGVNGTKSLHLTGKGYVTMGKSRELQPAKLSTAFWLRAPKGGLKGEQLIVWNKATGAADGMAWQKDGWYMGTNDGIGLELSAGASSGQPLKLQVKADRNTFFPAGEWVHVVMTYDSDTQKMQVYRNGVQQEVTVAETAGDGVIKGTDDVKYLGTNSWPNNYVSYDLDEFAIYKGCLTEEEARALYTEKGGVMDYGALVAADKAALTLVSEVTGDFALPAVGRAGGSAITWKSSDPEHITDEGKVTRPAAGEKDARVKLTATLTNGDKTDTKELEVTVVAKSAMMGLSFYDNASVEVTDAYYDKALELDVANLLALDADRLLAGFRETAAYAYKSKNGAFPENKTVEELMKNKTRYGGGWENSLIGGHTMGHYLTAVAQAIVNPGVGEKEKSALTERLNELITALKTCQEQTLGTDYEGYIFGATLPNMAFKNDVDLQFDNVDKGMTNIGTQAWVPWYTMHKILAGLNDAYALAGNADALLVANRLGTWIAGRVNTWSKAQKAKTLGTEYGGMNDCLYELYKINAKLAEEKSKEAASNYEDFRKAADMFDEDSLFERVYKGGSNVLNGLHANTTIPKFLGALNGYEADSSKTKYLEYVKAFWQMVVDKHTYITGGNSEDEHFGADEILDGERTVCNNETCNTNNMLKLSRKLFAITGEKKYADYYERTLINAIMASQNHENGLTMYFQPMATGYHKVFGTLDNSFWCCTGTGMENFTKLQDSIYFHGNGIVAVNQYLASVLTGDGFMLEQTGDLTAKDTMTFKVTEQKAGSVNFDLRLRIPDWAAGDVTVRFGDEAYQYVVRDDYIVIPGEKLKGGAEFRVTLPMEVRAQNLPDGENTYAFQYGPYVLSAKLGTDRQGTTGHGVQLAVPNQKAVASDELGITAEDSVEAFIKNIGTYLVKDGDNMSFTLNGTGDSYTFVPHFMQDESYGIYWTYHVDVNGKGAKAVLAEKNSARMDRAMLSEMAQAGRGQYENQFMDKDDQPFGFVDEKGDSVADSTNLSRKAGKGSSFGYLMAAAKGEDNYLYVTYAKEDDGKPMKITIGDSVIVEGKLDAKTAKPVNLTLGATDQGAYYQVAYKVAKDIVDKNAKETEVKDGTKLVKKDILQVNFAGTAEEESARICKSVLMMRGFATTNQITKLTGNGKVLTAKNDIYAMVVPYSQTPEIKVELADTKGYAAIDGLAFDEKEGRKLSVSGGEQTYKLAVYAENFEKVKELTLKVTVDYTGMADALKGSLVKAFAFDGENDGAVAVTKADVPSPVENPEYTYTTGKNGKALELSGSYGLRLLEEAKALGRSYTISFWMKPAALGGQFDPIVAGGTFVPEYWLNLTCDGKIWSHNADYVATPESGAYKAGQWQQVTLSVDGDRQGKTQGTVYGALYVDGVKVTDGDVAADIMVKDKAQLYFGINKWDAIFTGAVDDIMLFNQALTGTEIGGICANAVTPYSLSAKEGPKTVPDEKEQKEEEKNTAADTKTTDKTDTQKTDTFVVQKKNLTITYKISGKNVTVSKVKSTAKKVTIPATVKSAGTAYKVTAIAAGAFKNNKKLVTLVLGKNVKTIGKKAFYGCRKLKDITVKSSIKTIGKNAFSSINKKACFTLKVGRKEYKKLQSLIKKKGAKKAKFK